MDNSLFIYRFNKNLGIPCYILKFQDVNILLDCPLDLSVLQNFLPKHAMHQKGASNLSLPLQREIENQNLCSLNNQTFFDSDLKVGFLNKNKIRDMYPEKIDAVLISNSLTMLGLPFITQHYDFKGKIYATEPTIQYGSILMRDILSNLSSLPKNDNILDVNSTNFLKLNSNPAFTSMDLSAWYNVYSEDTVKSCLQKIIKINYNDPMSLFGLLTVRGLCSGYSIGSCNWIIESKRERIAYISHSSEIFSHVQPMDTELLKEINVLIIGSVVQANLPPLDQLCSQMCEKICDTIKAGGNVLIPINMCGLIFDIVERLYVELDRQGLNGKAKMFMLSNQAKQSLAYANIYGEWLNGERQNQLYSADSPFIFNTLTRSNMLIPCESINGDFCEKYRSPAIVFASHPSLRMGPAVHLLRLWGNESKNGLFIVDTDNSAILQKKNKSMPNIDRMIAPFCPLQMKVHYFPFENKIKSTELQNMVSKINLADNSAIVLPSEVINALVTPPSVKKFSLSTERFTSIVFPNDETLVEEILIVPEVSDNLKSIVVDDDTDLVLLNARITQKDGISQLTEEIPISKAAESKYLFGQLDTKRLITELHSKGLIDAKLEIIEEGQRYLVYFSEEDSLIQLNYCSTHVVCDNEVMRKKIQEAIVASFV